MKIAIVTGGFDPLHSGHIDYLNAARQYGEQLWVGVNSDAWLTRKKGQPFLSYKERVNIIDNLRMVDRVIPVLNDDKVDDATGSIYYALKDSAVSEIVFANGGDRSSFNSPEEDIFEYDKRVRFVYGVGGDTKKNSSSWILNNWSSQRTDRDWGYYKILHNPDNQTKVKELTVGPGRQLSMQKHKKRSEFWIVTEGTATIYTENDVFLQKLEKHEYIFIDKEQWHKLCNETDKPLKIVEIQYGENCVESDIERA